MPYSPHSLFCICIRHLLSVEIQNIMLTHLLLSLFSSVSEQYKCSVTFKRISEDHTACNACGATWEIYFKWHYESLNETIISRGRGNCGGCSHHFRSESTDFSGVIYHPIALNCASPERLKNQITTISHSMAANDLFKFRSDQLC